MEKLNNNCHVLIAIFPGQGHINPSLQFSKKLINLGVKITLSCSLSAFNRIKNLPKIQGLTFAPFSDGYDGNFKGSFDDYHLLNSAIKSHGSEFIANLIKSMAKNDCPFTRVIYTIFMDWVGLVAKKFNIPSTLFWIQPATVFNIYYYRFTNFVNYFKNCDSHDQVIELPGLPSLSSSDLPSFVFDDVKSNDWAVESIKRQIESLNSEENPRILVNTFDALELNALRVLKNVTMVGIGPSIPSSFLDEKDNYLAADMINNDNNYPVESHITKSGEGNVYADVTPVLRADMIESENNYMEWLDARANKSVIYIAFGSYAEISSQWMEEIGQGLLKCGRPFLWVIRETLNGEKPEEKLTCKDELEKIGKIVRWCSQMEVLKHHSVGSFLTHCGWNSTLESLASGVPIVACPIWNDQICNAKLIQDVWKIGIRVNADEEGIVKRDEFEKCVEIVMGDTEEGEELRKNAQKWKDLAKEAMMENGSSNVNLKAYVNGCLLGHC